MRQRVLRLSSYCFVALLACPALAQEGPYVPWVGERGVTETVHEIMARELHSRAPARVPDGRHLRMHGAVRRGNRAPPPLSAARSELPPASTQPGAAPVPQGSSPALSVGSWFLTAQSNESVYFPPDPQGAVGPTQILVNLNGRVKVFDKQGHLGGLNTTGDNFFQSVLGGSIAVDPEVCYDRTSGRFFCTAINETSPNRILIAVSSGSTITDQSSFTFFYFVQDQVAPPGDTGLFADYDKMGVDANALYVGANIADLSSFIYYSATGWVVKKSSLLSGGPLQATAFRGWAPVQGGPGPYAPMGVENDDPGATEGYFVGLSGATSSTLTLRRISNPGGNPSVSGDLDVSVPPTGSPQNQPALGSLHDLQANDERLISGIIHRDRATGAASLWTSHQMEVDSNGDFSFFGNRNGTRWYQIGNLSTAPALTQSGTLFDPSATNPRGYWFGACAMSGQGHMFLASSCAGLADHVGIAVSGRLASDPPGSLQSPALVVISSSDYNAESVTQRWGDMARAAVDPSDDQTVWAFCEYCNANNSWGVAAVRMLAPPPATPSACVPSSLSAGSSHVIVGVSGLSSSGSGFYDTEPGYNRIVASVSGGDVTVNSVHYVGPTQLTLELSVSPSAAPGTRTLVVINPDGQSAGSATGILTIRSQSPGTPGCFGDGTLATPCPCANDGDPGHGCENSAGTGGAQLVANGATSPDTLVLTSSGELASVLSIFLQGNLNNTSGIVFGDGLRCASGALLRLAHRNAAFGGVSFPIPGDPSISARSAALGDPLSPGATRVYQTFYRDAQASFCPTPVGNTWNVSNSQIIVW